MAAPSIRLVMRTGPTPGKVFELTKAEMSIGRETMNDLVVSDVEISRRHARLIAQSGTYLIEDIGSTNGTFVDGQRLMGPHLLRPGETIRLGENVSFMYEILGQESVATLVSSNPFQPAPPPPTYQTPPSYPPVGVAPAPQSQYPAASQPAYPQPYAQPLQPPVQPYAPPPSYPPQPESYPPAYTGQMPGAQQPGYMPAAPEKKKSGFWPFAIGCLVVLFVICAAAGGFVYWIDMDESGQRWCQYLPWIVNLMAPGGCPTP